MVLSTIGRALQRESPLNIMNTHDFIAVDFETATNNRMACQIGIVVVKNGLIVKRIIKLIQPPHNKYDDATIRVHHITPDTTKDAPTFDKVWYEIEPYFIGNTIVAHNAQFDEDVLYKNLSYYGILPLGINPFKCTCNIFHRIGLHDLCIAFGMPFEGHHNALFDAECCAQFYLNHLNGIYPDLSLIKQSRKKFSKYAENTLSGDILKKDLSNADPNNPFYDKKVVITGNFTQPRKELSSKLKLMGADINTCVSKKTIFILIGDDPGPKKLEDVDKLLHNGFNIKKLYQSDIDAIFNGEWEPYKTEITQFKQLDFTYEHYIKHHITFENNRNVIASKELYYGKGFSGNFDLFNQITGNLGALGDNSIFPETNICVLSNSTLDKLKQGEKDETILYIQDYYNSNKSIIFDFSFLSECDILDYVKWRCTEYNDSVTLYYYNKYIESIDA